MGTRNATFVDAIRETLRATVEGLHVCLPASVQSYDPATQTVNAQPLIKRVITDEEGNELVEDFPQIRSVPVAWPRAGLFLFTMPLAVGDLVLLVFADRSLDRWRAQGGTVDPGDLRTHNLSDAVAIPGVYPTAQAIPAPDVSATGTYLGKQGGPGVHITAAAVELGGSAAAPPVDFVALATATEARIAALETAMGTHVHPGVLPGPSATGPSGLALSGTPVAATKVKAI